MAQSLVRLCGEGDLVGVRAALARGADVNSRVEYDIYNTGLRFAVMEKHNGVVKFLLEQPILDDLNCTDREGNTVLHIAADNDNVEAVRMILANVRLNIANHKNCYGETPVMFAMITSSLNVLRELVAHPSVDLDTKDSFGKGLEEVAR